MPHQGIDAIAVAAYIIAQLQTIVSRDRDPLQPAVLSIGTIQGGSAFNVLAERVQMSGTLRTFDPQARTRIIERMHGLLGGVCAAHGARYELTFRDYAPPVVNDAGATEHLRAVAASVLGDAAVAGGPMMMVAEDVAEFLNRAPGCFFVLGAMPETTTPEPHHSPRFDIDERALPLGVAILAQATYDWLRLHAWIGAEWTSHPNSA
jgi:amidohydrolase